MRGRSGLRKPRSRLSRRPRPESPFDLVGPGLRPDLLDAYLASPGENEAKEAKMPEDDSRQGGQADDELPRSIFVRQEDPRKDLRETVGSVFSDRFMAFLSLILLPVILLPFFVTLSAPVLGFFEICDVTVILLFTIEYSAKLYLAKSRWEYFR